MNAHQAFQEPGHRQPPPDHHRIQSACLRQAPCHRRWCLKPTVAVTAAANARTGSTGSATCCGNYAAANSDIKGVAQRPAADTRPGTAACCDNRAALDRDICGFAIIPGRAATADTSSIIATLCDKHTRAGDSQRTGVCNAVLLQARLVAAGYQCVGGTLCQGDRDVSRAVVGDSKCSNIPAGTYIDSCKGDVCVHAVCNGN